MALSFDQKRLRVTVTVTRASTTGGYSDFTYVWTHHRIRATVREGGAQFGNASLQIYGVPLDTMNQISRLWAEALTPQNTDSVLIETYSPQGWVPFFRGIIAWAVVNASAMPEVSLDIEANSAMAAMNLQASPYANAGPVALQDVLTTILAPAALTVTVDPSVLARQMTQIRVTGSPLDQAAAIMSHYPDLTWYVHLQQFVVRNTGAPITADAVDISPATGLAGYPIYSSSGISLATLFNPNVRPGISLKITSDFVYVTRTQWVAAVIQHNLEANVPGGQWITQIAANAYGSQGNTNGATTDVGTS